MLDDETNVDTSTDQTPTVPSEEDAAPAKKAPPAKKAAPAKKPAAKKPAKKK